MCGIAGWLDFNDELKCKEKVLNEMTDKLIHRGPDDKGIFIEKYVALGHRRLAVIDIEGGKQPFLKRHKDSLYVLVYNGELYNTKELRDELTIKGHKFKSHSDTEVLLASYIEWGENCLSKLNGIFAFAVFDTKNEELFLARDRIGVKPLFYHSKGDLFVFASEIKSLLSHPKVTSRVNSDGLSEIFCIGPARTPGCGVFYDVSELKPGYCMYFNKYGLKIKQYWKLSSYEHRDSFDKTVEKVRELTYDSIKRQLVSDVPLCTLLSGGLDSSLITAIASEEYKKNDLKLNTYSIDYVDNNINFKPSEFQPNEDFPYIKKMSDYSGTNHKTFFIDTPELVKELYNAVIYRDLPGMADIDSSLLIFSKFIKEKATVGLSGECADEVFGGYPWFYKDVRTDIFPWMLSVDEKLSLFSKELLGMINPKEYIKERYNEAILEVPHLSKDKEDIKMRNMFYINLTRWMPTLLDRKDRMSMACGLELRVPFCDHRLLEYVWNIPWDMKFYKNREKGLLRKAMSGFIPDEVLWRKKSPYPKTHNPTYIKAIKALIMEILNDISSLINPLLNIEAVKAFALNLNENTNMPWFGQLMNAPQLLAYFIQLNYWLKIYKVIII